MADDGMWKGRHASGYVSAPTTDAPLPELNHSCPECGIGIVDGSSWQLDPEAAISLRLHSGCLSKRQERRAQERARAKAIADGFTPGAGYAPEDQTGPAPELVEVPAYLAHEGATPEATAVSLGIAQGAEAQRQQHIEATLIQARALQQGAAAAAQQGNLGAAITLLAAGLHEVLAHLEALR